MRCNDLCEEYRWVSRLTWTMWVVLWLAVVGVLAGEGVLWGAEAVYAAIWRIVLAWITLTVTVALWAMLRGLLRRTDLSSYLLMPVIAPLVIGELGDRVYALVHEQDIDDLLEHNRM